jgi:ankyrin repeat protein
MKHLLLTTIAAVVLVGCGESQQSAPAPEAKPVEPVAEAAPQEQPTTKAPDISIYEAVMHGNVKVVKQHIAAGADVNANDDGVTPLHYAAGAGRKEIVELLITEGADVNAKLVSDGPHKGKTPLNAANEENHAEITDLLRKHGGKTAEELKAEGK